MNAAILPFPREVAARGYLGYLPAGLAGIASPHTRRAYETGMRQLLDWLGGDPLTVDALRGWVDHLQDAGASAATINLRLAAAKRLCGALEEAGRMDSPAASRIARLKGRKRQGVRLGHWLTEAQTAQLLESFGAEPSGLLDAAIFALLYGAGLRESEAAAFAVEDLTRRDGQWLVSVVSGKGDKPRAFAVLDSVAGMLQAWAAAANVAAGPLLRPARGGVCLSACAIYRRVRVMGGRIGVPELAPHDLRRSCGRHIVQNGGEVEQVRLMFGHADTKTTLRYLNLEIDLKNPPAKRLKIGREES